MRSKRARLFVLIAVLAFCFVCLWPSLCWYARTPKEEQNLALGSLEKIKDYSTDKANTDIDMIFGLARANPDSQLTEEYAWLEKVAKKNYKLIGEKVSSPM
ncbi:MAG: protein translocase subunit SecD, partial [Spirochaetaceae bacterium]|nr:protein translocase subunit SecD [Spirochaetaceae bacterium]